LNSPGPLRSVGKKRKRDHFFFPLPFYLAKIIISVVFVTAIFGKLQCRVVNFVFCRPLHRRVAPGRSESMQKMTEKERTKDH
jgi:hypothetical protein